MSGRGADLVRDSAAFKELQTTKFGMNDTVPQGQTSGAAQAALAAYANGANGLDSQANMQKLVELVIEIRAALVANGTIKGGA